MPMPRSRRLKISQTFHLKVKLGRAFYFLENMSHRPVFSRNLEMRSNVKFTV